jgi:hypothetical protein
MALCTYEMCWECPRASIKVWTRLILFANTFWKSTFRKSLCTYKGCWKWCPRASIQAWTRLILFANTFCRRGTGVSGNFAANYSCTKSVYLLPSRKTYSTRKTRSWIERTAVSKNLIKQLHTLPVLHFNRCLTTEYSLTTAHCNGNFDTDNQIYVR